MVHVSQGFLITAHLGSLSRGARGAKVVAGGSQLVKENVDGFWVAPILLATSWALVPPPVIGVKKNIVTNL